MTSEIKVQRQGGVTQVVETANRYDGDGDPASIADYALGALVSSSTTSTRNGVQQVSTTANSYHWYDGAVLGSTSVTGATTGTTWYSYDGQARLTLANVQDGRARQVYYTNDMHGQLLARDEADSLSGGDPHERWYRFNGREMGYTGNNGTLSTDYQSSVDNRPITGSTNAFRNGTSAAHADFDQFYAPVTTYNQGAAGGSYTARGGETLASIAGQLWGDPSLWYKLAQANGLSGGSALAEGQRLIVPGGVMRSTFNAATLAPYDPAAAMGDTSPTTPTPQAAKKGKCGTFGMILMAVVAVAVVIATKGAATKFAASILGAGAKTGAAIVGGALAGAAGSVVSQGVGLATGIQNKFNWGAVGLAAIGGGVGGGIGGGEVIGGIKSKLLSEVVNGAVRGVLGNVISQGLGVATGLQSKFDWAGVATAGIGGAASSAVGGGNGFGSHLARASADGIASAAARSLITGTSFGDNIVAVLPGVIGRTIGGMIERAVAGAQDVSSGGPEGGNRSGVNNMHGAITPASGANNGHVADPVLGAMIAEMQQVRAQAEARAQDAPAEQVEEVVITASRRGGSTVHLIGAQAGLPETGAKPILPGTEVGHTMSIIAFQQRWREQLAYMNKMGDKLSNYDVVRRLDGFLDNARLIAQGRELADTAVGAVAYDILVEKGSYVPNPIGAAAASVQLSVSIYNGTVDATDVGSIALQAAATRIKPLKMLGKGAAKGTIVGGPANRAAFETYKDSLRAGMEKPFTSDSRLSSILDDLYRPNATVGSGSTAAAVRQELATGASVGGKMHSQKAADSITALEKWLERNPTARPGDRAAAENVIKDTRNALGW